MEKVSIDEKGGEEEENMSVPRRISNTCKQGGTITGLSVRLFIKGNIKHWKPQK